MLRVIGLLVTLNIATASRAQPLSKSQSDPQPDAAMLQPVHELVEFMRALPLAVRPKFFAPHVCIIENFAPFFFCESDAALSWETGFRQHAAEEQLAQLALTFGEAHDYSRAGKRVYFSLPTTWTGRTHGRLFVEHGAWAFVLQRETSGWRIAGYGWGVTNYSESAQ